MIERIALISVHASPLVELGSEKAGGMNVYVREVARELGRRGIKVDVYTAGLGEYSGVDVSLGDGVRVVSIPVSLTVLAEPASLYPYLEQFVAGVLATSAASGAVYDLIYSHYWLSGWVARALSERWNIPFWHMFHTLGYMKDRIVDIPGRQLDSVGLRVLVEERILQWADGIIAATPAERAQLIWLYRGYREKIQIVPPGVDLEKFYPIGNSTEIKSNLGLSDDRSLLLFVGRLEPLKAVDLVFAALDLLRSEAPDLFRRLRFVVVGGGDSCDPASELNRLRALSNQMGLSDAVEFAGTKQQLDLADLYRASMAVVVPSDYESFGMVALEAMACGALVIASGVGGLAYLVPDGEAGWLVPSRDSWTLASRLKFLLENPEIRKSQSVRAAVLARRYVWREIVDRLLGVFQGLSAVSYPP